MSRRFILGISILTLGLFGAACSAPAINTNVVNAPMNTSIILNTNRAPDIVTNTSILPANVNATIQNLNATIETVFSTQAECEQATSRTCIVQQCDYIPPGQTMDEVCGPNFRKGWVPQ